MAVISQLLEDLLEPVVSSMGYEFVGLKYISQGRHSILRVYIDKEQGVGVDDCAKVSRQLSAVLDVEDPIAGEYSLEVSSPGLDRPLFKLYQYGQFVGTEVRFRTLRPQLENGQRKFQGIIQGIDEHNVIFLVDQKQLIVPYKEIEKANLVINL